MKKILIYSVSLFFVIINTAASCGSSSDDPTPQKTTLGLVGGRWELETSVVIISKNGKERARVEKGPGLGYIFNADGSYDGCAMTVSDWSYPIGASSNVWNCTSKGGGGTWKYTEQGSSKDPQTGLTRTEGTLTLYPKTTSSSRKELTYVVYLTSNNQMAWNKDEKDPDEPDLITLSTFIWKLKK